ncbi:uncharacterized protein LOC110459844, partial [Mizuhopecten yessoensis]|uniref:uncharacterized protein LOC110459844 n=1 Tax=Mizuhopecten yessoensis TaxID=6573 RepID=UPI000B4575E7
MTSSPQKGIYVRLKTKMNTAYYTDTKYLESFRTMASAHLSGPGEYKSLPFLDICENLEGNGHIGWNKLGNLKELVQSTTGGQEQLLCMINDAEKEIQESLSAGLASPLPPERDAPKRRMKGLASRLPSERDAKKSRLKDEEMVVQMDKDVFRVKEKDAAFLECSVDPEPIRVVWKKGEKNRVDERIIINNKKYFGAGPSSPALVIKEAEKADQGFYQCIAKAIEIEVKGKAVPLEVDSDEERGSNKHGTHRSQSASSSGTEGSHIDRNSKSSSRSQDNHMEFRSFSPEDRHQGKQNTK